MAWKTVNYASVDVRDGEEYEVLIDQYELVEIGGDSDKKTKKPRTAPKFYGLDRVQGPISFLATDNLAKLLGGPDAVGHLFQVQWKGKKAMRDGRSFNMFSVQKWEGPLPEWAVTGDLEPKEKEEIPF